MRAGRRALAGGIVGPAAFVGAWAVLGATTSRPYSPVEDAISRLAESGAPTQPGMTLGFVAFGIGVPLFGLALRRERGRPEAPAWPAAVATGLATLGVAATPLETSPSVDLLHGAFATVGYATLAAAPWLGGGRSGRLIGAASAAALAATVLGPAHGLFQRLGLTLGDAWLAGTAVRLLRAPPSTGA